MLYPSINLLHSQTSSQLRILMPKFSFLSEGQRVFKSTTLLFIIRMIFPYLSEVCTLILLIYLLGVEGKQRLNI